MKSFYEHLRSRLEFGEQIPDARKPVLRSSGIFPVIRTSDYSTQVLFLGYWHLKRNISEISSLVTLRDKSGNILKRNFLSIQESKAFTLNLDSLLPENQFKTDFIGSLEVEFFSTRDMVYPYPALVLNYFNQEFNTCVHTVGRIYNDYEDLIENEKFVVPETGFDVHSNSDLNSFLAFVNGPQVNKDGVIEYVITNHESRKVSGNFSLGKINSFETVFLKFADYIPKLEKILEGKSGTISLKHNFTGFYPRFLVGNIQKSFPSVSLTHSYYDCTFSDDSSDYWNRMSENYHDSSVYVPLFTKNKEYTELIIYPNLSPSILNLQIDFHDKEGNIIKSIPNYMKINSSESKLMKIDFNQLLVDNRLDGEEKISAHIITNSKDKKIPTRMKFGLNVGVSDQKAKLPCNICFNTKLGNPLIEEKPGSFHWCPIFCDSNSVIAFGNFAPKKEYSDNATVELNFYHEKDSKSLKKIIDIPANTEYRFELITNDDVQEFLGDRNGWLTIKANNPFVQGFYFNFHSSGAVAGDHWF